MNRAQIAGLVPQFLAKYDPLAKDRIWQQHSEKFRRFLSERILPAGADPLQDEECDEIIRILDTKAKGNTKADQAVANTMVPQGAWRKILRGLQQNHQLSGLVESIFKASDLNNKAALIDELYQKNTDIKRFTVATGKVINALLSAYDPLKNLTMISLNHREALMDFLAVNRAKEWGS